MERVKSTCALSSVIENINKIIVKYKSILFSRFHGQPEWERRSLVERRQIAKKDQNLIQNGKKEGNKCLCNIVNAKNKSKKAKRRKGRRQEFIPPPNPVICIEQKGEMGFEDQIRLKFKHNVETKSSPVAHSL